MNTTVIMVSFKSDKLLFKSIENFNPETKNYYNRKFQKRAAKKKLKVGLKT